MDSGRIRSPIKRRACTICASSKLKCQPTVDGPCERCLRLNKRCVYHDLVERKQRRPRPDKTRVDVLEETLQRLQAQISQLTNQDCRPSLAEQRTPATTTSSPAFQENRQSSPPCSTQQEEITSWPSNNYDARDEHNEQYAVPSDIDIARYLTSSDNPHGPADLNQLLAQYRAAYMPLFPFVVFPASTSFCDLSASSPFLLKCILYLTMDKRRPEQAMLRDSVMKQLCDQIMFAGERSFDLLRGLLVLSAWCHQQVHRGGPRTTLFIQLCITLSHDLDLDNKPHLSNDEKRGLLATYWLSIGDPARPVSPEQMEKMNKLSLQITTETKYEWDSIIWPLIAYQNVFAQFDHDISSIHVSKPTSMAETLPNILIASRLQQLDRIKNSVHVMGLSGQHQSDHLLALEVLHLEVVARQVMVDTNKLPSRRQGAASNQDGRSDAMLANTAAITGCLWDLLHSCRHFVHSFTQISEEQLWHFPSVSFSRLFRVQNAYVLTIWTLLERVGTPRLAGVSSLSPSQRSEAQAVLDAAMFQSNVAELSRKFDIMRSWDTSGARQGSEARNSSLDQFAAKLSVYARCFPRKVRDILGERVVEAGLAPVMESGTKDLSVGGWSLTDGERRSGRTPDLEEMMLDIFGWTEDPDQTGLTGFSGMEWNLLPQSTEARV